MFTAATALAQGFGAHYTITVPQPYTSKVYRGAKDPKSTKVGPLVVMNDDPGYKATYDMTSALVASTNTYYVALEDALGSIAPIVQTSEAMGMTYPQAKTVTQFTADQIIKDNSGTFTLGAQATNPLDLATAYATVAASGTRCTPTPVTAVLDQNGQPLKDDKGNLYDTGNHCTPNAIPAGVANTLANMMTGVVSPAGTGRKAIIPGHTIGGKTGTTQGNNEAAFGGILAELRGGRPVLRPRHEPEDEATRGRRRRWRAGADLPRRDGADPGQPARPPVPAGRPGGRGRDQGRRPRRFQQRRQRQLDQRFGRRGRRRWRLPAGTPTRHPTPRRSRPPRLHRRPLPAVRRGTTAGRPPPEPSGVLPQPSWRRTSAATREPSARPATAPVAAPMTLPMSFIPAAPVRVMTSATIAARSASSSCAGR